MFLLTRGSGDALVKSLSDEFKITYEGEVQWGLGVQFTHREDGSVCLRQAQYCREVVERFRMTDCNSAPTPLDTGRTLGPNLGEASDQDQRLFREFVGCLMYLAIGTRPDLALTAGLLSRFVSNPSSEHMAAMKRTLRYLKGTQGYHLVFRRSNGNTSEITAYSDADWGGEVSGCKSTTG